MEILSHWKGVKITCGHCASQFTLDGNDIKNGVLLTESDAMLRAIKDGIVTVLYVTCPACDQRVNVQPTEIPLFYRRQTRVAR